MNTVTNQLENTLYDLAFSTDTSLVTNKTANVINNVACYSPSLSLLESHENRLVSDVATNVLYDYQRNLISETDANYIARMLRVN